MNRDQFYTPNKINKYLSKYAELSELLEDYSTPSLWQTDSSHSSVSASSPAWCNLVEIKADLDRAIITLTPRLQRIAIQYFKLSFTQEEIAKVEKVSHQQISNLIIKAETEIGEYLIDKNSNH